MKKFFSDFKKFIAKGNILDMAVGVVVGGAFGKIVTSLVSDIITPFFGFLTANVSFADLKYVLTPATEETAEVAIRSIRRDAMDAIKQLKKDNLLTEDTQAIAEKEIQKILDNATAEVDKLTAAKEREIMEI